jgi:signal transduction histidine kinase
MDKEKPIIKISSTEHKNFYEICINDNGSGIAKTKLNKIFNVFEVGHENEKIESHGLGLSIVKKLVEDNGGKIFVESEESIGTTFHFTILKD